MSGGFTKSSIRKYELLTGDIFSKYVLKIINVKSKALDGFGWTPEN